MSLVDLDSSGSLKSLHLLERTRVLEDVLLGRVPKSTVVDWRYRKVLSDSSAERRRGKRKRGQPRVEGGREEMVELATRVDSHPSRDSIDFLSVGKFEMELIRVQTKMVISSDVLLLDEGTSLRVADLSSSSDLP